MAERRPARCAVWLGVCLLLGACRAQPLPVRIPFAARVGGQPFACDRSYAHVGSNGQGFTPQDLRLFVHDVALVDAAGGATPVALDDDGHWQGAGVALLDFENGSGACANGTPGTHTVLTGTAPRGAFVGVRFILGVPFTLNHANPVEAKPPLNLGQMNWSWQGGYKFLRFEGSSTDGHGYRVHLGSTGCEGSFAAVTHCARDNQVTVQLDGFRLGASVIVLDLAALLAHVDLAASPADGSPGCLSEADDPDCAAPFAALGLDLATGAATGAQHVFSVQRG